MILGVLWGQCFVLEEDDEVSLSFSKAKLEGKYQKEIYYVMAYQVFESLQILLCLEFL